MQWWPWKTTRNVFYAPQSCPCCSSLFGLKLGLSKNSQKLWSNELFFTGVSFELDKWPWRTIGYLLYTPRSFVHHFIATCELKLELSSRNAEIVAKLAIFWLTWPRNLTDDLKNSRAPLPCQSKLCASFHSNLCILKMELSSGKPEIGPNWLFLASVT